MSSSSNQNVFYRKNALAKPILATGSFDFTHEMAFGG